MTPTLNPDYELIYIDQETDKVFLKNHFFKNLVSLSKIEYEIIQFYTNHPDCETVFAHYSEQYEMSRDFVYALVHKAESSGVLISEGYLARKEKVQTESNSRINIIFYILVTKLQGLVSLMGVKTKLELRGNFKYYRLFSFSLDNTLLEKNFSNRFFQSAMIVLYFGLLTLAVYSFAGVENYKVKADFTHIGWNHAFLIIPVAFVGLLILTFLHELGHFLLYKRFGGITSEMGVALMTGIIPTLYVTTSSLHLWKSRAKRVLVMLGGTLVDILLLITFLYFAYSSVSAIAFYAYIFAIMMVYRIAFNINPLVPRTDGYFMMCEIISQPTFHSLSYSNFVSLVEKLKEWKWRTISFAETGYSVYFMLSILFMVANYLFLMLPLIIFIYYWIVGGRR